MSALCQKRTSASSFDQVVGNGKYARRNSESECLSSRQINNELEFRWLLDRKIRRACTLENLIHIPRSTPEKVHFIRTIGDEAAVRREVAEKVNCRHTVLCSEFDNPLAMNNIMTVRQNEKATVRFAPDIANGILNVGFAMHLDWDRLYPQQRRACVNRLQIQPVIGRGLGVENGSDSPNTGHNLLKNFKPFGAERNLKIRETRDISAWMRET